MPVIRNKATAEEKEQVYRLKGGYLIPMVALLISIWAGFQSEWHSWVVTGGLLLAGFVLYALASLRQK